MLATVIVNESVTDSPAASVTVRTTLWSPTSSLVGVPVRTPVLAVKVNQLGTVVPAIVSVSPVSASLAVSVYVYTESSVAVVTAVLVTVGASLALATTIVNESNAVAPATSVAVITTAWEPTSLLLGVPVRAPAVQDNQLGTVVQVRVTVSPASTSEAVVVYE